MLILAEGAIHRRLGNDDLRAAHAWFGELTDAGFMVSGYLDEGRTRMWMVLSAASVRDVARRLSDIPLFAAGEVTFDLTIVTSLRTA